MANFDALEKADFARHQAAFGYMPSPRGVHWRSYIEQRARLLHRGLAAYATRRYARHDLHHYIESNRESDKVAAMITNNMPTMIYLGAAEMSSNRPIGIKRRKRCPGTRKFLVSVKKLGHSRVKFVDEYFTSQTCGNCFGRFDRNTRNKRFKYCRNCQANPEAGLPPKIVTPLNKRVRNQIKRDQRDNPDYPRCPLPKMISFYKEWPLNNVDANLGEAEAEAEWEGIEDETEEQIIEEEELPPSVVWHRDIVAAKCILYKGK